MTQNRRHQRRVNTALEKTSPINVMADLRKNSDSACLTARGLEEALCVGVSNA